MYWLGLGMRSAFLPDSAAALEVGGQLAHARDRARARRVGGRRACSSRPIVLRRMARRQSGSQVEAAREAALQWIR